MLVHPGRVVPMYLDGPSPPAASGSAPRAIPMEQLYTAVRELGTLVVGEVPLAQIYARVAQLAKCVIPGADAVSVTLVKDGKGVTAAATDQVAQDYDDRQYENGAGPCLHAAQTGETVSIPDLRRGSRWPQLTRPMEDCEARSSLSVALPLHEGSAGAFNIYALHRGAFGEDSREIAEYLAEYAAAVLSNASLYDAATRLSTQLHEAILSRATIEQAKGIIMGERRCTADEAFAVLAKVSQDANRKLKHVAAALVEQAAAPGAQQ